MKKSTIIMGAFFAAFLMLSTIAFSPVTAQKIINPPQEKDGALTQIADLTNSLTSNIDSFSSMIAANDEINTLMQQIGNNEEIQQLIEQIQNTDNEKEKHLLAEQLIEMLYSLPEYEQLESVIGASKFTTQINNINQDIETLLSYIESNSYNTNLVSSSDRLTSFESSNSNFYPEEFMFVMPTDNMIEYHYVFYPDEETDIPDPTGEGSLTYGEILDMLQNGEITLEDLQDLLEAGDLLVDEYLLLVGQYNAYQNGDVQSSVNWIWAFLLSTVVFTIIADIGLIFTGSTSAGIILLIIDLIALSILVDLPLFE